MQHSSSALEMGWAAPRPSRSDCGQAGPLGQAGEARAAGPGKKIEAYHRRQCSARRGPGPVGLLARARARPGTYARPAAPGIMMPLPGSGLGQPEPPGPPRAGPP